MSGVLDDGVRGLAAIRARDGITIVQTSSDAVFPALPMHALEAGVVDHEVAAAEIGALLVQLAHQARHEQQTRPARGAPGFDAASQRGISALTVTNMSSAMSSTAWRWSQAWLSRCSSRI